MKKSFMILIASSLLFTNFVFASDVFTDSKIVKVIVYPDSALVTRSANVKLDSGESKVFFNNVISYFDQNSLRVSASEPKSIKIFGASLKQEFLEENPAVNIKEIQDKIQLIEDDIRRQNDFKAVLIDKKNYLDSIRFFSNQQIPKDLITKMPLPQDLDATLKFLDSSLKENYSSMMECELKIRDFSNKLNALQEELNKISGPVRKEKRSIVVDLEALRAGNYEIKVSYLVNGATWNALYDARADFEKSEVEMVSYGIVQQNTGEDWMDVDISLSTARPTIGGNLPYVDPWILRPLEIRQMETYKMARMSGGFKTDRMKEQFNASAMLDSAEEKSFAAPVFAQAKDQGTSVVYEIPKKAVIKSDNNENKLPVSTQQLNANFGYSAFPRAVLNAYLGSKVVNSAQLQLLAGRVNIFLNGDFVGTSNITNIGPSEEFSLYLGVDENVKVKRDLIEKKVDETLIAGIPSPNKKTTLKYKITIENYKSKNIKAKLFESTPVAESDKIKVKVVQVNIEPNQKDWENRKGVWLWELELTPKEKKEIFVTYVIEHPKDLQVEGL